MPGERISIHTPLRERQHARASRPSTLNFNPRSLAGATSHLQAYIARHIKFQSTLPYRSDVPLLCFRQGKSRFQSTLPYRSDITAVIDLNDPTKFQSTLPYRSDNINFIVHEIKEKSKFFANPYK